MGSWDDGMDGWMRYVMLCVLHRVACHVSMCCTVPCSVPRKGRIEPCTVHWAIISNQHPANQGFRGFNWLPPAPVTPSGIQLAGPL